MHDRKVPDRFRRRLRRLRRRQRALANGRARESAAVLLGVVVEDRAVGCRQLEVRVVLLRVEHDEAVDAGAREQLDLS